MPSPRQLVVLAGVLAMLATLTLAEPASADPSPSGGARTTAASASEEEPCDGVSIGCMVEKAVHKLFGGQRGWVTAPYLRWLIRVPNLAGSKGAVADLAQVTRAAGWALLLGLVTFSVFHYYALGLTSRGSGAVLTDAVTRCVGAALIILAWPWLFANGVALTDTLSDALIPGAQLEAFLAELVTGVGIGAFLSGPVALGVGIVIALGFILLSLALYLTKLGLTAGLLIAYVTFPLAAALWVIPSTAQPASYAARFCAAAASTQVVWALCIALMGALNKDTLLWSGGGPWTDKVTKPLFIAAMLAAMLSAPRHTFQAWGLGLGGGGGFLGSASSFAASQFAIGKAGQLASRETRQQLAQWGAGHLPGRWPGQARQPSSGRPTQTEGTETGSGNGRAPQQGQRPQGRRGVNPTPERRGATPTQGQKPPPQRDLPTGKGAAYTEALGAVSKNRATDPAGFRTALDNVSAAGFGRAAVGVLGGDGGYREGGPRDTGIMETFAAASVGPGAGDHGNDFRVLAASTPKTRLEGLDGWTPPTSQPPPPTEEPSR